MYNTVGDTRGGAAVITQSAREHQHQHLLPAFQPSSIYISTYLNTYLHSILSFLKTWNLSQSHVKSSACMFHYLLLKSAHCNAIYYRHISADIHSMPSNLIFSRSMVLRLRSFESRNWSTTEAFQENSSVPLRQAA